MMRRIPILALLLFSPVLTAETQVSIQIGTLPAARPVYPYPPPHPHYAYPERSYYYYDGISQYGGGQIRTEQYHRGGIGHTEYRSCTTTGGATLCTGNWRPSAPVHGGIRIEYRR